MNYYAKLDENLISIVEGIYESKQQLKARVIGAINNTDNTFCKFVKQPYDVLQTGEYTITMKKRVFNMDTHRVTFEETYTLLTNILTLNGYTQERITQIIMAIQLISNDSSIKSNQGCIGSWISLNNQGV